MFDQIMLKFLREMLEKSGANLDQATIKTLEGEFLADLNGNGKPDLFDKDASPEAKQAQVEKIKSVLAEHGVQGLDFKTSEQNGFGVTYSREIKSGESDLQEEIDKLKQKYPRKNFTMETDFTLSTTKHPLKESSNSMGNALELNGSKSGGDIFRILLLLVFFGALAWYMLNYLG